MSLIPELGSCLGSSCRLETGYSVTAEQHEKVTKRMAQRRQVCSSPAVHLQLRRTKSESAIQTAKS
jgi:hypothetical protein